MPGVDKIVVNGREIIYVDYSHCKTDQMVDIFNVAKEVVVASNVPSLILTNFTSTYVTPHFLRHAEQEMLKIRHLIEKNAFIGMDLPKKMILKGFNIFMGKEVFVAFDTQEEAIAYLIGD